MLLLPSAATFIGGTDGSAARMISVGLAIFLFVAALHKDGLKKLPNIWAGLLLIFIVFSSFHSPSMNFESLFTPKDNGLFNFKPLFECLTFFALFMAVYSIPLTMNNKLSIHRSFAWIGIIYSAYICLQHLGMDQIFRLTDQMEVSQMTRNPESGGFAAQPVYAAAVLVICLPFVFRQMIKFSPIVLFAIAVTGNRSALIASAILTLYLLIGSRKVLFSMIFAYIGILALAIGIYALNAHHLSIFDDSGRFNAWILMIQDFVHPHFPGISKSYVLTGFGIGSFSVIFPFYNHSSFFQAHNEFIEVFYTLSFIGLFLFIKMIVAIFKNVTNDCILMSLAGILICALTHPVWHNPQLQFLTVFLVGLAYNKELSDVVGKTASHS